MTLIPTPIRSLRTPGVAQTGASVALISGTAYFNYIGFIAFAFTPQHVRFLMGANGSGGQTAEIGLFSTPSAPNLGNQSLTKLVATGAVDSVIAGAPVVRGNTNAFATVIPAGTYLWAGIRVANVTTQPTIGGWAGDNAEGYVLTAAASGALTGAGPFAGVIPTTAIGGGALNAGSIVGLNLMVELD